MTQALTVGKRIFYPPYNLCSFCRHKEGKPGLRPIYYFRVIAMTDLYTTIACPKCENKMEYLSEFIQKECEISSKVIILI